ncbi:MAG: rhomboid family intramembrane serine protease [Proteobacteria bacterium]|nr:rhomboid family intramembrane serine protease [Pseudomonadota bacterium]
MCRRYLYAAGMIGTGLIAPFIDRSREARKVVGASCGVCSVIAAAAVLKGPAPLLSVHGVNVMTPLELVYACIALSVVRHVVTRNRVYHLGHAIGFVIGLCVVDWIG